MTCTDCHAQQAGEISGSVHASFSCHKCHGGRASYDLRPEEIQAYVQRRSETPKQFDHGPLFRGQPVRAKTPELCGTCHANVELMNPYGLRTDQLARYWTSGHGKTLAESGDERVAVCVDCHSSHSILPGREPRSKTHPLNVPDTCGACHEDTDLMGAFELPVEVVDEYRQSVHGRLLLGEQDTGAPTCATCHGNHSAVPPGYATVGAVCGKCHQNAGEAYAGTIHAEEEDFRGCLQCHGGGEGDHGHLIRRISPHPELLTARYSQLLATEPEPTPEQITADIHPEPRRIMAEALPMCLDCHEEIEDDESLQKLFGILDTIAEAERRYVKTGKRLADMSHGVLLVDAQLFAFEDAKTHLIGLAPLQHSFDAEAVTAKLAEFNTIRDRVETELDELENGLQWRHRALGLVWVFALLFATALYVKYKRLKAIYVDPFPHNRAAG